MNSNNTNHLIHSRRSSTTTLRLTTSMVALLVLSACGGGGGGPPPPPPAVNTFSVSGTVSGLVGSGLVLQKNGGDNLAVAANGSISFATAVASGSAYSVTVLTQPTNPSQTCVVTSGSGTASANVSNVAVVCTTNTYTIGGSVSGLAGTGLVLQKNASDNLAVAADGAITFATAVTSGSAYVVTVLTQPTNPSQTCAVTNGSGSPSANVTNVAVVCTTNTYVIGGTVSGLAGTGLVLQKNGGDNLAVTANGAITFATAVTSGSAYVVTVLTQPTNLSQTCAITNGTGTAAASNVTNVAVVCTTNTFTVSGRIVLPSATQTDTDTNDIIVTPVSNNSFQAAQALPNPVIVGGYVNRPGAGPTGPLRALGDPSDYYSISLVAGQVIELLIAASDTSTNDLDLDLYTSAQVLAGASVGIKQLERITVVTSGQYFIRVYAYSGASSGASNYVLSIGQTGSVASESAAQLTDEFVPGEVLAKFSAPAAGDLRASQLPRSSADVAENHGLKITSNIPGFQVAMKLDPAFTQSFENTQLATDSGEPKIIFASELDRLKYETLLAVKRLGRDAAFEWAQVNWVAHSQAVPNDPNYSRQRWHYEMINLPGAWNITTGSSTVIVAVVDSGVRAHVDLASKLVSGYDFVLGANTGDGDGEDADASDPGVPTGSGGYVFHGTHVAGTVGALSNNGVGVAGVAWGVQIMPVRVLGANGSGSLADILTGVLYAGRQTNRSALLPARRADVINLSLGREGACSPAEQQVIDAVRAAGVVVVAAAGNSGSAAGSGAPANCNGVISVSALNSIRAKTAYSNSGANVDVAAPGGEGSIGVFSTYSERLTSGYRDSYAGLNGTSMAAPHVAGVIALMRSANPALTPSSIDALLASGALTDDIGAPGPDALGVGLINALKAVTAVSSVLPPSRPAQLNVVPSSVNFGDTLTASEVTVANTGTGVITVISTAASASWLTVAPARVDASGLGAYRVQISRAGLPTGTYAGWVEFRGSVGTAVRVTVQMQVSAVAQVSDAGQHYILLFDADTLDSIAQVEVYARGTAVNYSFPNVAQGRYRIAAGTDLDNDGFICGDGEACAEFPVFGAPTIVDVTTGSLTNVDLPTAYRIQVRAAVAGEVGGDSPPAVTGRYRRLK